MATTTTKTSANATADKMREMMSACAYLRDVCLREEDGASAWAFSQDILYLNRALADGCSHEIVLVVRGRKVCRYCGAQIK